MERKLASSFAPPPVSNQAEWRRWMRALGADFRRVRQFLGLSQEELARYSGVSQGAVSRLESGRGLHTPFFVLVRLNVVLAAALRQMDQALLTDDVRAFLTFMEYLAPPRFRGHLSEAEPEVRISRDEGLERLTRRYHALPERQRPAFMSVLEAMADALAS